MLSIVLVAAVLTVHFMLARIQRRVDRLADQTLELVKQAERQFEAKQPPEKQG